MPLAWPTLIYSGSNSRVYKLCPQASSVSVSIGGTELSLSGTDLGQVGTEQSYDTALF